MAVSAQTPAYAYDKAAWRQSVRNGRERGCWVYIPRDELQAAGISVEGPPPAYRLSGMQSRKSSPRVIVNLKEGPW